MPMGRGPKRTLAAYAALVLIMTVGGIPVLAAGDPLAVINNLSTFIFSLIRAIGDGSPSGTDNQDTNSHKSDDPCGRSWPFTK